jgi:hypothetical protein
VLDRVKQLRKEAATYFSRGLFELGSGGVWLVAGGVIMSRLSESGLTANSPSFQEEGLKALVAAVSGATIAYVGTRDLSDSIQNTFRANALETAVTKHLLDKYNTKQ